MGYVAQEILQTGYKPVGQRRLTDSEKAIIRRLVFVHSVKVLLLWLSVPVLLVTMMISMVYVGETMKSLTEPVMFLGLGINVSAVLLARHQYRLGSGLIRDYQSRIVTIYEFVPVVPLDPIIWDGATKISLELLIESERIWSVNGKYARHG